MVDLIFSDCHAEEEGAAPVDVLRQIIEDVRPRRLVLLGDTLGFSLASGHPRRSVQMRLSELRNFMQHFFDVILGARRNMGVYWLHGNHEDRIERMFRLSAQQDPAWGMGCEGFLTESQARRVHVRRYRDEPMKLDGGRLEFFHGSDSKRATPTLQAFSGECVFQGHTHQLYAEYIGGRCAVRCGHLGPERPEYIKGPTPASWQRGFVIVEKNARKGYNIILEKL